MINALAIIGGIGMILIVVLALLYGLLILFENMQP